MAYVVSNEKHYDNSVVKHRVDANADIPFMGILSDIKYPGDELKPAADQTHLSGRFWALPTN